MFTSRLCGGTPWTRAPEMRISPSSGSSKPASIRSVVVLPQPDGPRSDEELAGMDLDVEGVDRA